MEDTEEMRIDDGKQTSSASVALAWLIVSIPLAWGVYETFIKSLALFQ